MEKLLHERIAAYAAVNPSKTALLDTQGEISYGQLEAMSASLACELAARGVRQGDAVAVYVPYGKDILVGAVSALRAGGIFIPFDEAYPVERLESILQDSETKAILTVQELWNSKTLHFPKERVIFMDETVPVEDNSQLSIVNCQLSIHEDSPAMLLYTSGTTGRPKGVLHTHKMLTHIVDWMNIHEGAEMDESTRTGVMSGISFVGTQMFLLGPLSKGGTVCFAPEAARKDVGFLYQFIQEVGITHIFLPAALAAIMAEDYDISGRFIFAAGEKLRNFRAHNPGNVLINSYGCTETSGVLSKKVYGGEERVLVGKPFSNTKTLIVDDALRPVPRGEAGELVISNDFMSRGYFKLPEQSAEKWKQIDGVCWYRTGDRARYTDEGDVELLGRIDNMVKLRGFRIETGEVEAQIAKAISKLSSLNSKPTLVVVVKNLNGVDHLSCYYEAKRELDKNAVKAEIAKSLAEYMIPDVWVRMDVLPRNANGKVMRGELPNPKRERIITGVIDSEVLFRILATAEEVLDGDTHIGPDERFTDVGGTSLVAMKYATALRQQGIKITGKQILQYNVFRKISEVAEVAYEQLWSQEEFESIVRDFAARGEHIEKVLPITNWQNEMLFRQLIKPDSHSYRNVVFLQVDSIVGEAHLREALDIVARENEQLRSAIVFHGIPVIQQVITDRRIPLEMLDAAVYDHQTLGKVRDALYSAPIDLQFSPMMRMVCLHANGKSFLYVMTHNIAVSQQQLRGYLLRLMQVLAGHYPDDVSISGWVEILSEKGIENSDKLATSEVGSAEGNSSSQSSGAGGTLFTLHSSPSEMCVYSANDGPKMVFVHTANTGSDAYYQLADRISDTVSFAVIEPYNLYHPDDVRRSIKAIASNYIRILKAYQPEGPYILGGWCYGGIVAHEMACQLREAGEDVQHLIMLDSHALGNSTLREMSRGMFSEVNVAYFETCPLFAELREAGMLEAMVNNAANVADDLMHHSLSFFDGNVTYFKPDQIPAGVTGDNLKYWAKMMEFEAGNFENYCDKSKLHIIHTPHEHDLMMDDASLDIIVPELYKILK
ncbi:MAG: AMP-binding protein [Bacteroidaceae bacterium]|nr:AMP-binding protein [Bacteroidaceae bacterium]